MKQIIITIITALVVAVLTCACTISIHKMDTGKSDFKKSFDVSGDTLTMIHLFTYYDVEYSVGDTLQVTVAGDEAAVNNLNVQINNGVLAISSETQGKTEDGKIVIGGRHGWCKIHITAPSVPTINIDGGSTVTCKDTISVNRFATIVSGSGVLYLSCVNCQQDAEITVQGSGAININNVTAQSVNYYIGGSGSIGAAQSNVGHSSVSIAGSGYISIDNDQCGEIETLIQGSGDIVLKGTVTDVKTNVQGSGNINTNELQIKK